jgi:hypothetical protein
MKCSRSDCGGDAEWEETQRSGQKFYWCQFDYERLPHDVGCWKRIEPASIRRSEELP